MMPRPPSAGPRSGPQTKQPGNGCCSRFTRGPARRPASRACAAATGAGGGDPSTPNPSFGDLTSGRRPSVTASATSSVPFSSTAWPSPSVFTFSSTPSGVGRRSVTSAAPAGSTWAASRPLTYPPLPMPGGPQ